MNDDLATGPSDRTNGSHAGAGFGAAWQGILAEAAGKVPGFREFLESELRGFGPHFAHAVWLWDERGFSAPKSGWRWRGPCMKSGGNFWGG